MEMFKKLGPGLLYAAAAIGVSHLIQSTRAGASFGTGLLWAVVAANLFKYPFFKLAPLYAVKTNRNLIDAYQDIGSWATYLVIILTFGTMFIIQAAVTIVTAGITNSILGLDINPVYTSITLLGICAATLYIGKYSLLDQFVKYVVVILTFTTFFTVVSAGLTEFPKITDEVIFSFQDHEHIFFLIALIGWMPAPMDIPIWHSLWVLERNKENPENNEQKIKDTLFDFNVGYIGTAIVAIFFVLLGSFVMYRSGNEFSPKAAEFASTLINMYTNSLGSWSYPIIAVAAFTTMFSTTITCLDAFPRVMDVSLHKLFKGAPGLSLQLLFVVTGTSILLFFFLQNMKQMVDFATTVSFIVAPLYAFLNFMIMRKMSREGIHKFSLWEMCLTYGGLLFFCGLAIYYLIILG